jgi:hypothetical protein
MVMSKRKVIIIINNIRCRGDMTRIALIGNSLVMLDHDQRLNKAIVALGGQSCRCYRFFVNQCEALAGSYSWDDTVGLLREHMNACIDKRVARIAVRERGWLKELRSKPIQPAEQPATQPGVNTPDEGNFR